ncbi:aspartic proteinase CDR1-like [Euphorbia lathyris]|uniref:aspartic proteinase CDR1-like n=1 Tax=Euphorbia lathyris TaxID=212925 RepID=UPI003313AFC2
MNIMEFVPSISTFLVTLISIYLANLPHLAAKTDGFSVDLIHRNSPLSPLYNTPHQETPLTHFKNGFERARSRINRLNSNGNNPQSDVLADNGEHIMKFSIGNPPMDIYGIVDTGSDLVWTQCQPCEQCYNQKNPIYNPKSSSTYTDITCNDSPNCHDLLGTVSCSAQSLCSYTYGYGSNDLTQGVLAKETFTFNGGVSFQNIVFGCGHNNTSGFNENEMGLVGLGGRKLSLVSQIGSSLGNRKFSYCLVPFHTDPTIVSKMYFGSGSEVTGKGVISIPLVQKEDKTPYFITVTGISVGNKFIPYSNKSSSSVLEGNMFIDSGVPPILLPNDFYNRMEQEVKDAIKMEPYQDPDLGTQLCYKSNKILDAIPILLVHFENGAAIPLVPSSTFIPPKEDVFCFAMAPTPTGADIGVFGNFAQNNFRIGFDLDKQVVSFEQADCAKNN